MEEKDFNEMLLEDKKDNKNTKNIILGAIGVVVILIVLLIIWSLTRSSNPEQNAYAEVVQTEQITQDSQDSNDLNYQSDDRFDQIIQDVKNIGNEQNHQAQMPLTDQASLDHSHSSMQPKEPSMPDAQLQTSTNQHTHVTKDKHEPVLTKQASTQNKKTNKPQAKKMETSPAQKGSYLQVGVFSKQPSKELFMMLKTHPYKTQEVVINGQQLTRYLVGPFQSRSQANQYKENHPELHFSVYFEVQ